MGERKRNAHSKVLDKIKEGIVARSFVNRVRQFEMRQNTHTHTQLKGVKRGHQKRSPANGEGREMMMKPATVSRSLWGFFFFFFLLYSKKEDNNISNDVGTTVMIWKTVFFWLLFCSGGLKTAFQVSSFRPELRAAAAAAAWHS